MRSNELMKLCEGKQFVVIHMLNQGSGLGNNSAGEGHLTSFDTLEEAERFASDLISKLGYSTEDGTKNGDNDFPAVSIQDNENEDFEYFLVNGKWTKTNL